MEGSLKLLASEQPSTSLLETFLTVFSCILCAPFQNNVEILFSLEIPVLSLLIIISLLIFTFPHYTYSLVGKVLDSGQRENLELSVVKSVFTVLLSCTFAHTSGLKSIRDVPNMVKIGAGGEEIDVVLYPKTRMSMYGCLDGWMDGWMDVCDTHNSVKLKDFKLKIQNQITRKI